MHLTALFLCVVGAATGAVPDHLRLPLLRGTVHATRPHFLATLKQLSQAGESVPTFLVDAVPPAGNSTSGEEQFDAGASPSTATRVLAGLPLFLSPLEPIARWAIDIVMGENSAFNSDAQAQPSGATIVKALAKAASAGYAPAIQLLASLRLFGRREIVTIEDLSGVIVPVDTSMVGVGKEPPIYCSHFAELFPHEGAAAGAGHGGTLTLRFSSIPDTIIALAASACIAHNELDVLAHHAHTIDSISDPVLALEVAESARSPLLGALLKKHAAAGISGAKRRLREHFASSRRSSTAPAAASGDAASHSPYFNSDNAASDSGAAPPSAGGSHGGVVSSAAWAHPMASANDLNDAADAQYDEAYGDDDVGPLPADELAGMGFDDGYGGGSGDGFSAYGQPPPPPPSGPWVTGTTPGTLILPPQGYEPAALGVYIRRDVLVD